MRKKIALLMLVVFMFGVSGCSLYWPTTTQDVTTTFLTSEKITTTTTEIDLSQVVSAVYAKIYNDLYDEVREEVIADIADQRFDQIYAEVIQDLSDQIALGEITVAADSIVDMIFSIVEEKAKAVVGVSNFNSSDVLASIGSGVIYKHVGSTYFVVTNEHVIEEAAKLEIYFEASETYPATLLGYDETSDLAVLSFVSDETYPVVSFGESDTPVQGSIVLAVGNPSGYDYFGSVTMGIVSGSKRYFDVDGDDVKDMFIGYVQHDAAINSGNSGGALFNLNGEVIGINVIKIASTEIEGMGFAIPSALTAAICQDIEEFGFSKQVPGVGIQFNDIATDYDVLINDGYVIPEGITAGFYVHSVTPNSSADGYVLPGDIILEIGDVVITNLYNFSIEFSKYHVGDVVDIVVYRNGERITLANIELKTKV